MVYRGDCRATEIGMIIADVQKHTMSMIEEMIQGLEQLEKGNIVAEDTIKSFGEIGSSIKEMDNRTQGIVNNVKQLAEVVSGTSNNMNAIDSAMQESSEVARGISDTVITETANLEELTATMTNLAEFTVGLKEMLAQFKL